MTISEMYDITGKSAIVTGAGRGIGKVIALTLAEAGADIAVTARTVEQIEETANGVRKLGRRALVIPADVTQEEQVKAVVDQTVSEFGKIDILVNNAGDSTLGAVTIIPDDTKPGGWKWARRWGWEDKQLTLEEWRRVIDVDLTGAFIFAQAIGPQMMRQRSGRIINITSVYAEIGVPRAAPYCASKAALAALTRCLAVEWAPYDIRVNAIGPGFVRTELTEPYFSDVEWATALPKNVPLRRVGEPRDVALLTLYLASDASNFMTGQSLYLDGGLLAPGRNAMEW